MMEKIRVMLVDDHAVVRVGFRMLIDAAADIEVVAEADSGEEAYQQLRRGKPDVVVMDLAMPGMGGIETVRRLLPRDQDARVLVLVRARGHGAPETRAQGRCARLPVQAHRAGGPDRRRARGRRRPRLSRRRNRAQAGDAGSRRRATPVEALSEREFTVFIQLARGQSVNQIAEISQPSPNTVGTHLYNIKQKLGRRNQAELDADCSA